MGKTENIENISCMCEFFEDLDELVYISDIETYDLVYMNRHLRDALGYRTQTEYDGKKCYEVLHGGSQPCAFCTNHTLRTEKRLSRTYKNPLLGKRFLVKDNLFYHGGRPYRIELAIDADADAANNAPYYYARGESLLSECLKQMFSTMDPEESLDRLLHYLGQTFQCDRAYVFELSGEQASNTYEWCGDGVLPQRDILQNIPAKELDWWLCELKEHQTLTLSDLEDIRTEHPVNYATLKAQNISSLCAGAISQGEELTGFIGVDNPSADLLKLLPPLLKVLGYFLLLLLTRRETLKRLKTMSYCDSLTGALNRNALQEQRQSLFQSSSVGVIYCDITGLKQTNDLFGHHAGDQLIQRCYDVIREALDTPWIYRVGGDEFVALYQGISRQKIEASVERLNDRIQKSECHVDVGHAWSDQRPFSLETLLANADHSMYQNKWAHYAAKRQDRKTNRGQPVPAKKADLSSHPLCVFLNAAYYDPESFFQAISQQNSTSYFYIGDLQKDLYYISDNMRDDFGFLHNVVPSLLSLWEQRISDATARAIYRDDIQSMLHEKRTTHDLRYQVRDAAGKNIWVHCYGVLKWNEDKTAPLFFSGRITRQDDEFMVDPVTNFYFAPTMLHSLDKARIGQKKFLAIGFSFNHITEINSTRGRTYSDHLIQCIAGSLVEEFSGRMTFYRLEGMRCMALTEEQPDSCQEVLVQRISDIVSQWYHTMGISVQRPCSFALMQYPHEHLVPSDFLDTMLTLIRTAKREPSRSYVAYSVENIAAAKVASDMELALSHDILHDMEHFRIVVQPIVSAQSGEICGGEALLRWEYQGRAVSPEVFVPILEKENMIQRVGRWVFEQAVCTCLRLRMYVPDFYLSFNVSLQQMSDAQLPEFMKKTLEVYKLDGSHLLAEMTESCMDERPELLMQFVDICKKMGIRMALDDFGSGYSSLKMLLQYPSNIIKLDKSLLSEIMESGNKLDFISSIVYACHRFGKQVCMEGVETAQQAAQIREAGCDLAQGYYYHRPMELPALYQLLSQS